ncbi:MAG: precorrin-2 C(20)-methyltransferase [Clostridia bacterium]|nr:precorrin-2 C(20)-methyltransferase [Clostridia bacterium]
MKNGILYGVGVGPGEPELLTMKAARLIRESEVVALPGNTPEETLAYQTAVEAVPELAEKTLLPLDTPMVYDLELLAEAHRKNAREVASYLEAGKDVVYLCLGDPGVYGSFNNLRAEVAALGFACETVAGITSFCAAAARLGIPLSDWDEHLHIVPCVMLSEDYVLEDANYIFMKPGKKVPLLKRLIAEGGYDGYAVMRCGMEGEQVFYDLEDLPDDVGYMTLIIAKKR